MSEGVPVSATDEYTPTTENVREAFSHDAEMEYRDPTGEKS